MSSRRITKFVVLSAVLLALPVVAFAQTSRLEGMALPGDYVKDYTGIYTYTSEVSNVGNLIYGELGNLTSATTTLDRSVGAVIGNWWDGRYGTWAIHLREETPALGSGDQASHPGKGVFGFDPNVNTNESFDVMWGKKFGTTSLGLRLNRSQFKATDDLPGVTTTLEYDVPSVGGGDPNLGRNLFGIGGGLGFELNPTTNAEFSLLYQSRTFQNSTSPGGPKFEDNGGANYQLAGRLFWKWEPNVVVVPVFKYYSFDLSTKSTVGAAVTNTTNSLKGWQVGIAGNWTVGSNDLYVMGVSFAQNTIDQQYDLFGISASTGLSDTLKVTEMFAPNVFAALETHVNNWLTCRFGAQKGAFHTLKAQEQGTAPETIEQWNSPFTMELGLGVKLGTLQLDAQLNPLFPHTLGGWFSNLPGGFISFPKVTATYAF